MLYLKINITNMDLEKKEPEVIAAEISNKHGVKVMDILVAQNKIDKYVLTTERYCPYDCVAFKNHKIYLIEFKHRNCKHNAYDKWLLEKKKNDRMKEIKANGYYYLNTYEDNKARMFCINDDIIKDITVTLEKNKYKLNSNISNVNTDKICLYLPSNLKGSTIYDI